MSNQRYKKRLFKKEKYWDRADKFDRQRRKDKRNNEERNKRDD